MARFRLEEKAILLHPDDDVAVAVENLAEGTELACGDGVVTVRQEIPAGHKVALKSLRRNEPIRKYGHVIGETLSAIDPGDHVHTHNLHAGAHQLAGEFSTDLRVPPPLPSGEERTFLGYPRSDGRAGTRNYIALISTVNCSADTVHLLADCLNREALPDFPNVDGIAVVSHKIGCGMAINGAEHRILQRCLTGIADHPNVSGAILIGLGCEVNQAASLLREGKLLHPQKAGPSRAVPPVVLTIQEQGGVGKTLEAGYAVARNLLTQANERRRTPVPLTGLTVGTNCGGSDGNSGITANPALGLAGDEMVRQGGGWVLAETPETYGAEHLLTRRAVNRETGEKLVELMRWWERYTQLHGAEIDNNPAPGNKDGGLTTIYEKSMGAVTKSGSSPLRAVYDYAQRIDSRGLSFMDTPGHDPTSVTGLAAGGCNLIAFTTGRGSCLGFKPSPVLKIATNTPLYERMPDDMDLDAGTILRGIPIESVGRMIFEMLVAVASGKKTKSELQGLGDHEFAPWTLGPVL